jgi:hypothetical protein
MLPGMNCGTPSAPANEPFGASGGKAFAARKQQELGELPAEVVGAPRIVERQRRQRVDRPVGAGIAAVERLDADDRDDDLGRHAERLLGARERRLVRRQERDAFADPLRRQELRRVFVPLRRLDERPLHGRDDLRLVFRIGEPARQRLARKPMLARELIDVGRARRHARHSRRRVHPACAREQRAYRR